MQPADRFLAGFEPHMNLSAKPDPSALNLGSLNLRSLKLGLLKLGHI
tara:strand:+ start:165 stop:305 length:141 start_codon:yes stop_codon:yes gene_type:complete